MRIWNIIFGLKNTKSKKYSRHAAQIILAAALFFLLSCGGLESPDANANLPQKQNTNLPIAPPVISATPTPSPIVEAAPSAAPTLAENVSTNASSIANSPANVNVNSANNTASQVTIDKLIIPVAGIKAESLRDTFNDARSEGRVHDAIDIMAAGGTPVLAAADGEIARFFDSEKGGITIYQFSRDKKLMYYYAHLRARADDLQEHQFVRQRTVIGYVGDTGNAGTGNFHLHFAIWIINDPKHYWDGTNINPYPLLR